MICRSRLSEGLNVSSGRDSSISVNASTVFDNFYKNGNVFIRITMKKVIRLHK